MHEFSYFLREGGTLDDGPQLAAHYRSCAAAKAATTALVVATRAAVDRCGPGHVQAPLRPTGTEDGQGRGGGSRDALHGGVEDASSPAGALQVVR